MWSASPKLPFFIYSYTRRLVSLLEQNASSLTMFLCLIFPSVLISALTNTPFILTLVEDHSRCTWTFLLSSKLQVHGILKEFLTMVKTQFGVAVKCVRSDNGSEFVNKKIQDLFSDLGILHQRSCVYTPQQNGVVERKHRSLLQVARAVMFHSHLPPRGKFDSRSKRCVMLGYAQEQKGYVLYDITDILPDVQSTSLDLHWPPESISDVSMSDPGHVSDSNTSSSSDSSSGDEISVPTDMPDCIALSKGKRVSQPPTWTKDFVATCLNKLTSTAAPQLTSLTPTTFPYSLSPALLPKYVTFLATISELKEPMYYSEACKSECWVNAMNAELTALEENGTWIVTDLPADKKPIGSFTPLQDGSSGYPPAPS